MTIQKCEHDGVVKLTVSGAVNRDTVTGFSNALATLIDERRANVELDLAEVPSMCPGGAGAMILFFRSQDRNVREVKIVRIHRALKEFFEEVGLTGSFGLAE